MSKKQLEFADQLSDLEDEIQMYLQVAKFMRYVFFLVLGFVLLSLLTYDGTVFYLVLSIAVIVFVFLRKVNSKAVKTGKKYTNIIRDEIESTEFIPEHRDFSRSIEELDTRYTNLDNRLDHISQLARQYDNEKLKEEVLDTDYYLDHQCVLGVIDLASHITGLKTQNGDQQAPDEKIKFLRNAMELYETAESIVSSNDQNILYDSSIAKSLNLDVPEDELLALLEVGSKRCTRLHRVGFKSLIDVKEADPNELAEVKSIGNTTAKRIIDSVEEYPILDQLSERQESITEKIAEEEMKIDPMEQRSKKQDANVPIEKPQGSQESRDDGVEKKFDIEPENDSVVSDSITINEAAMATNLPKRPIGVDWKDIEDVIKAIDNNTFESKPQNKMIRTHNALCAGIVGVDSTKYPSERKVIETAIETLENQLVELNEEIPSSDQETSSEDTVLDSTPDSTAESSRVLENYGGAGDTAEPSKEELLAELQRLDTTLKTDVSRGDMWTRGNFDPEVYESAFGSWDEALDEAGCLPQETNISESQPGGSKEEERGIHNLSEGRVDELFVRVDGVIDGTGDRRDLELTVETMAGDIVPLTIWSTHDIAEDWKEGANYRLLNVRHKRWGAEEQQHALSSTQDMRVEVADESKQEVQVTEDSPERDDSRPESDISESEEDIVDRLLDAMNFEEEF